MDEDNLLEGLGKQVVIGLSCVGYSDLFGPAVTSCVSLSREDLERLLPIININNTDSSCDANIITEMALTINTLIAPVQQEFVNIYPNRFNELYMVAGNAEWIAQWASQKVFSELTSRVGVGWLVNATSGVMRPWDIVHRVSYLLGRDRYLSKLKDISERFGIDLPEGETEKVKEVAKAFFRQFGREKLGYVAKLNLISDEIDNIG